MVAILLLLPALALAAPPPAVTDLLTDAYAQSREGRYDEAIARFREALQLAPDRAAVHKDLAYTLLKAGDTVAARDAFAAALRLEPQDERIALEHAFLCYETREPVAARRAFDRLRRSADASVRDTAAQAFENVDRPLREGIARWAAVVRQAPDNFSAREELARLAEQRDERALAAEHYLGAWRLRPAERSLLLALGRVWNEAARLGDAPALEARAHAALLAASRGADPRTAEAAREQLPARYPYVYEFREALTLDPDSVNLRRELAYLLIEMKLPAEAEREFEDLVRRAPKDLLSVAQLGFLRLQRGDNEHALPLLQQVLDGGDEELADRVRSVLQMPPTLKRSAAVPRREVATEAKVLGGKSLDAGYLQDARKYLSIAHENDPADFDVMLKLGWANNMLKQDQEAVHWFRLAQQSPQAPQQEEAGRAYRNLSATQSRVRLSGWAYPLYSSRWRDLFGYGQLKSEWRIGRLPLTPYLSVRLIGDIRGSRVAIPGQYLSESAVVLGAGVATKPWHRLVAWAEAGAAVSYLAQPAENKRMQPDYRAGVTWSRTWGRTLHAEDAGLFFETNLDAVHVSRFGRTVLGYAQQKLGYTLPTVAALGGLRLQGFWNGNITMDTGRQAWANFAETGPGVRWRWPFLPPSVNLSLSWLQGSHLLPTDPSRPMKFKDIRAGVWYAFTR